MKLAALLLAFTIATSPFSVARTSSSASSSSAPSTKTHSAKTVRIKAPKPANARKTSKAHKISTARRPSNSCLTCVRDSQRRIKRSKAAKTAFHRSNPCPDSGKTSGPCSGYVIDHGVALKRGGADSPSNMQWQTEAEAKAKDRVE
jgi:hypothetical protein